MNTLEYYEDREAILTQDEVMEDQANPHEAEEQVTALPQAVSEVELETRKGLIARLWQRFPRWNVETMYMRDEREFTEAHSFQPTSLNSKQIADIWMLNSKH